MATRRIRIWTGMGTYVLAGAGMLAGAGLVAPAEAGPPRLDSTRTELAQAAPPAATPETKPHVHPGTGGEEGGERGVAAEAPPDEAFLLRLLLIKGHLRIGRDLVELGRWNDAMPHFLHPAEEIYRDLAPALAERKLAPFDQDLAALAALVKAKTGGPPFTAAHRAVAARIEAAIATLDAETRARPAFVLAVAERLLETAAAEYKGALDQGRVANPVEYQDSRGFVWTAEELVLAIGPALKARDAAAFAALTTGFAALKQAWPAAVPRPGRAVPEAQVRANISRIVLAMSRLR